MPADIRTTTYSKTPLDLLPAPAGSAMRGGEPGDGFDSLLRALAPVERPTSQRAMNDAPPMPPPADDRFASSYESSAAPSTSQRPSDRATTSSTQSERRDEPSAPQENAPVREDETVAQSADSTHDDVDSAEAASEVDAKEKSPEADDVAKDASEEQEPSESAAVAALDPAAQQLAALATQASVPVVDPPLKGEEALGGDLVMEVEPAAKSPTTEANSTAGTPPELAVTTGDSMHIEAAAPENDLAVAAEQAEPPKVGLRETVSEASLVDSAQSPVAEAVEGDVEQNLTVSDLTSKRTQAPESNLPETPLEQPAADLNPPSPEATADQSEPAAENQASPEPSAEISPEEAFSDSDSKQDREAERESPPTQQVEPIVEASLETAALEPVAADLPPVEHTPQAARESVRSEQGPQQTHGTQTLVDPQVRAGGTPRLAAEVLAGNSREASHVRPVEIDSARFLTRVARAFTAAQQRGGEVQLRLSPPELGSLRVEIKVLDGVMTARVETENASAQTAVLEHLPQLRERLAEQGVRIERFDVDLMKNGSSGTPDQPADRQTDENLPLRGTTGRVGGARAADPEVRSHSPGMAGSGGLNVIV